MRKLYVLLFALSGTLLLNAQLSGTKNIPGNYATLAAAITDLNTQGVGSGGVTLNLMAGNPQTAPAGGYVVGGAGTAILTSTSLANQVIIQGNGNTITASGSLAAGSLTDGIFKVVGADWVTIKGFTMLENASNTNTTTASNNMTEWGVALLYASTTDGAQNVTVQGNNIDLNRNYLNSFGIYSNSTHSSTSVTINATATSPAGANSNLKIYGNTVSDVNTGIVVVGPTAAANNNDGLDIGGTSAATGNTITNFGTAGGFSFNLVSGTVNGILVRNTRNFNLSYNTIASSNGGVTTLTTLRGIYVPSFSNAPTGIITNSINNNNISVRTGVAAGAVIGIVVESLTNSATTTLNINSNDFNASGYTVAGSGSITFISNGADALATNINSNTFTNLTVNTTGSVTFINNDVTRPANAICNVNNNAVVTAFNKTAAGGTVQFYSSSNNPTPTSAIETNTGNNFSNVTVTGSTIIAGWVSTDGSSTIPYGPVKNVTNNTFSNIAGGTGSITVLTVGNSNSSGTASTVAGNTINAIAGASSIMGAVFTQGSQNISANIVNGLASSGAAAVTAILVNGGATQNVYRNKIYDLSGSNSSTTVNGILISTAPTVANIYNNLIGDLKAPTASGADVIRGISSTTTTAATVLNISYNTIYINASSSEANFGTSGIYHATTATANATSLVLRNNIVVNLSTPIGTGLTVAFRRSSTSLGNYGPSSNNNLFYAGTPSATRLISHDGTNADQMLAAFKTRVAPNDAASVSENPLFASFAGATANFLHIAPSATSAVQNGGVNISGITDDYDGQVRAGNPGYSGLGTAPDIGADEFDATPCLAPASQPTALSFGTITSSAQSGSFTPATGSPAGYLVIRSIGALTTSPLAGVLYATGTALGNGVVVQSSNAASFTATNLTGNTLYTYTVFSYNAGNCVGGPLYSLVSPLTGTSVTCPSTPATLSVPVIGTNAFRLTWSSSKGGGATPVTYTLEVSTSANFSSLVAGSPFTISDTTTVQPLMAYTVSGLDVATTYYYRLKASGCNSTTAGGSITTSCSPVTLPLAQFFNSPSLPVCWTTAIAAVQTGTKISITTQGSNPSTNPSGIGSHFVQYNSYSNVNGAAGSEERLITAPVITTGLPSIDVEFYWRAENNSSFSSGAYLNEGVQVQYSTDFGATWVNAGGLVTRHDATLAAGTAQWEKKMVTLPAGAGNQPALLVAFKFHSEYGDNMFLDLVQISATPGCYAPTVQAATNVVNNGARINWAAPAQAPASYEVYYSTSNTAPTGATAATAAGITNLYYDASGLTASTTYYVWVRGNCGGNGTSAWSAATSFTTLCAPVNVPYLENFDAVTPPALPGCTAVEDVNNDANTWTTVNAPAGYSGKTLQYSYSVMNAANDWFYTAGINLTAGVSYKLAFKYGNSSTLGSEKMKVYYGNGQSAGAMTNLLQNYSFITNTTINTASITFTPPSSGVYYIGFYAYSEANQFNLLVDDISLVPSAATLANDEATGAIALTVGAGCSGAIYSNVGATKSATEVFPSCSGTGQAPVWFKFVASSTAVRVSTDVSTGNTFTDSKIALFSAVNPADYGTFTILSCDEDGGSSGAGKMSVLYATGLTVGNTYYIAVDKSVASTANGTFCISVDNLSSSMLSTTSQCGGGFQTPVGNNTSYSGWVSLVDEAGRLVALVKNNSGDPVSAYTPAANVSSTQRQYAGTFYLNRNFMIANTASRSVTTQLFFLLSEWTSLNAADGTTLPGLGVTRQSASGCQANFAPVAGGATFLPQSGNGLAGGVEWIEVNVPTGTSNLYLNRTGVVLPVQLLSFSGQRQGNANNLKWAVAQEQDVQAYEIQRSDNNQNWIVVGTVNSLGNTALQRSYTFSDNSFNGIRQYYRLRQVDRSGAAKFSNTILISGKTPSVLTISALFPNPSSTTINLLVDAPQKATLNLLVMDAVGRVVQTKKAAVEAGANTLNLNVSSLAQGSYLLKLTCDDGCDAAIIKFAKE